MSNEPVNTMPDVVVNADGSKTLVVRGQTLNYMFAYTGPVPIQLSDLKSMQDSLTASIKAIGVSALMAPPTTTPSTPATSAPASGTPVTPDVDASGAILVGPNRAVKEIADAIPSLKPGGTIIVDDAVYLKSFHVAAAGATIKSASGNPRKCLMDGQGGFGGGHRLAWGKAMFHVGDTITIQGIGFVNCGSPASGQSYSSEAAVYAESFPAPGGLIHVKGCSFDNCGNGIFIPAVGQGGENVDLLSDSNVFGVNKPNGQNCAATSDPSTRVSGPAHDHYVCGRSVEVTGCYCYGNPGHSVKSRSPKTNVHDNPLLCGWGGRALEATEGGQLTVKSNVLVQRGDGDPSGTGLYGNANFIAYADENTNQGVSDPVFDGNTLHIARLSSIISVGGGATLRATNTKVNYYGQGSLVIQGNAAGLSGGSAPAGAPANYTLPAAPF